MGYKMDTTTKHIKLVILLCMAPVAWSQQLLNSNALNACRHITDTLERVACYDKVAAEAAGRLEQPSDPEAEARRLQEENWRQREELARLRNQSRDADSSTVPTELTSQVAALENDPSGWTITLENGQIWKQVISKRYNLKEGQQVHIYPSHWGKSYRLSAKGNGSFIQVKRLR